MYLHPTSYVLTFLLIQGGVGLWLLAFDIYCWDVLCSLCRKMRLPGFHPLIPSWTEHPALVLVWHFAEPLAIIVYRTSIFRRTWQVSHNNKASPELGHTTAVGTHSPWLTTSNSTCHLLFKGSIPGDVHLEGSVSCEFIDSVVRRACAAKRCLAVVSRENGTAVLESVLESRTRAFHTWCKAEETWAHGGFRDKSTRT